MLPLSHYQERRNKLFDLMQDNSIALIAAAPAQYRNSDTEYPFRQDSYFYYLTGFSETFAIAAFIKKQKNNHFVLFCQDNDPKAEIWTGARAGLSGAREMYGANEAYSISETALRFPDIFIGLNTIYYMVSAHPAFDRKLFSWIDALRKKIRFGGGFPHRYIDLRVMLDEFRLIKTEEELKAIRKACDISAAGHRAAMRRAQPGLFEYELEASLLHEFCRKGSRSLAYPSIVATGNNACTLHYTRNDSVLREGELVLIDAGAEVDNYAADISRTFPVNGKFSGPQQALYELVLAAQRSAIETAGPDVSWESMQQQILNVMVQGLVDLKILRGDVKTLIEEKAYSPFYMHNSGHWLGLDVHDVGDYKIGNNSRPLKPGMVFTVEPGLYFSVNNSKVPEQFRGIGIRIEDDVLITPNGREVLTESVPKSIAEIEKLMQQPNKE